VSRRCAEDRHHRVADELLDGAAEALELVPHAGVVGREDPEHVLGIQPLRLCREPDQVDEHDRHNLALLSPRPLLGVKRARAGVAEPSALRVFLTASRTRQHGHSVRRGVRPVTLWPGALV